MADRLFPWHDILIGNSLLCILLGWLCGRSGISGLLDVAGLGLH